MAIKGRTYSVRIVDGNGETTWGYLAQSEDALRRSLRVSEYQRIESIEYAGWGSITAHSTSDDEIIFTVTNQHGSFNIRPGDIGHQYASQLVPQQAQALEEHIDNLNNYG